MHKFIMRIKGRKNKDIDDVEKIPKLTKVLINDLRGPRAVRHNFSKNKIEKNFSEDKNESKQREEQKLSIHKNQNENLNKKRKTIKIKPISTSMAAIICATTVSLLMIAVYSYNKMKDRNQAIELINRTNAITDNSINKLNELYNDNINKTIKQLTNKSIGKSTKRTTYNAKTKPS